MLHLFAAVYWFCQLLANGLNVLRFQPTQDHIRLNLFDAWTEAQNTQLLFLEFLKTPIVELERYDDFRLTVLIA